MDAVEFLKENNRMCDYYMDTDSCCHNCPVSTIRNNRNMGCKRFFNLYPKEYVSKVEQWSKSHPRKTILDDLLEKYPNAQLEIDGTPKFCPRKLGYKTKPCCNKCDICWHTPLEEK